MTRRKSSRIRTTITLAFAALVTGTALIMALLSYSFTEEAVQRTSRDYTSQLIEQVQTNIDSYIAHMENIAEVVHLNEQVQTFFGDPRSLSEEEQQTYRERITSFLNSILRTRDDISLILIAGMNGEVLKHDEALELNPAVDIPQQEWYRNANEIVGRAVVSSSHVQNIVEGEYRWVITLSRTINNPNTNENYGVMLVDLNFSVINDLLSRISLGKKGYLFIVDSDGSIVYHPRQELLYSNLETEYIQRVLEQNEGVFSVEDEKGERIYTISTSDRTGWRTVGVNYASEMVRNRAKIRQYYLYWMLIAVTVAILVSILISHRLSRPLLRLRESMQSVEQGNFDVSVDVAANNEIGDLARDFKIMVREIKELMRRNAEEQEQKRKNELMALQNQITPHFLYNTLDSVIWMAEGKQYSNVVTTVSALARLLRLSVSRGDELISIRDEIEHIKSYLTIQKLRYRDKLDYVVEVDESILQLRTPKVILQPLVENAVYHGIKNKDTDGKIAVRGRLDGDAVILSVRDDGVGMSDEQLAAVLTETGGAERTFGAAAAGEGSPGGAAPSPHTGGGSPGGAAPSTPAGAKRAVPAASGDGGPVGAVPAASAVSARAPSSAQPRRVNTSHLHRRRSKVGVRNVHERIQLYFGAEYGLSFHRNTAGGTTVNVRLPIVETNGEHNE